MTDVPLLRNESGTARDRDPSESVDELEFEAAIGRNVRILRQQQGLTVAEMAARVSWLAHDLRDNIDELDLNPVVVLPKGQGAFAVDALLVAH